MRRGKSCYTCYTRLWEEELVLLHVLHEAVGGGVSLVTRGCERRG